MHCISDTKKLASVQENTCRKVPGERRNLRVQDLRSAAGLHVVRIVFMVPFFWLGVIHVLLHQYNSELVYLALQAHQLTKEFPCRVVPTEKLVQKFPTSY
jgi:hypothetical protein